MILDRRPAIFIVARMTSHRLPGKALLEVRGRPLLAHQAERLRLSRRAGPLVLCTSTATQDDPLAEAARDIGLEVFRGPELDVPRRLLEASERFASRFFILAGADEHFIEPEHVDAIIEHAAQHGGDWIHVEGNPLGAWVRGVSQRALRVLCEEMDTACLDGWGAFFETDDRFAVAYLRLLSDEDSKFSENVRLTIDYPEDFALVSALYDRLGSDGRPLALREVLEELRRSPELLEINAHRREEYWERLKANSSGLVR